jgi:hypothetical protein
MFSLNLPIACSFRKDVIDRRTPQNTFDRRPPALWLLYTIDSSRRQDADPRPPDPRSRQRREESGGGRRRGVFDVDVREDAATVADDWEPTLAEDPA